ncbi:hypothetical protein ACJMK2_013282, partial [Sinanodonta woodiana]
MDTHTIHITDHNTRNSLNKYRKPKLSSNCVRQLRYHSASASSETIWVKEVSTRFQTDKRIFSDVDLPDHLTIRLSRGSDRYTLHLERNYDINPNSDMYFVKKDKNGRLRFVKSQDVKNENVAYYQDRENGASMIVRCVKQSGKRCDRVIKGNIRLGKISYDLRPAEGDFASRNSFDVPSLLGKRYVLQDNANIRSVNAVGNDTARDDTKDVEQERTTLLRRLRRQKQTLSSLQIEKTGTKSDNNYNNINTREVNTRWLNIKRHYYVDVAVLVDSSVWDIYASFVRTDNILKKRNEVKQKIREYFSYIMNSVNLLYKGIEDPSISIRVILSGFIFFHHDALFPYNSSRPTTFNGRTRIAIYPYLADLNDWDEKYSVKVQFPFDHAVLFTHRDLYKVSIENNNIYGLTFRHGVCLRGKRNSIIQTDDYELTVYNAAHELGHNLGAPHDGDTDAKDCNPLDGFIMSPDIPRNKPNDLYKINRYRFSKCSVKAFKWTLQYKDCVKKKGKVYDKDEWDVYVSKKPGEVYSAHVQCHHINGPKSVCCATAEEDICHLMRCTHPDTQECLPIYYSAATGTKCGHNR